MALDSERAKRITLKGLFWEGRDARSLTTWRPRPEVGPCHEDCDEVVNENCFVGSEGL